MNAQRVDLDVAKASACAPHARLVDIVPVEVIARLLQQPTSTSISFRIEYLKIRWGKRDDKTWVAVFPFEVNFLCGDGADKEQDVFGSMRLALLALYEVNLDKVIGGPDALPHFLAITGTLHAWPYFRAEVQSLTAKLRLPSLTLPVLLSGAVAELCEIESEPTLTLDVSSADAPSE